jgi:hypothetical protein
LAVNIRKKIILLAKQKSLDKAHIKLSWFIFIIDSIDHRRRDKMGKQPTKLGNRSFYFEKNQCKHLVIEHWSWESSPFV